jgi:hypothetical protein
MSSPQSHRSPRPPPITSLSPLGTGSAAPDGGDASVDVSPVLTPSNESGEQIFANGATDVWAAAQADEALGNSRTCFGSDPCNQHSFSRCCLFWHSRSFFPVLQ